MHRIALTVATMCLAHAGLAATAHGQEAITDIAGEPSAGQVIQGAFAPEDGAREYWLTLSPGQGVEVTALPLSGADPVLTVYDDAGQEIASNDDYGNGLAARVPLHSVEGQRVRVVVSQLGDSVEELGDAPHFTLIVTPSDWQPAEPQTVTALPYEHEGELRSSGEQAYIFTAQQGDTFDITATAGDSGLDPYLRIMPVTSGQTPTTHDGETLAEDDDSAGNLGAQLVFTAPAGGSYAAIVSAVGSAGGAYTFAADRIEQPEPIAIGLDQPVQGFITSIAAPPVYRLDERAIASLVRQPGTLRITMNALGEGEDALDPYLKLGLDSPFGQSEIMCDDDGGDDLNALLTLPVQRHDDLARWLRDLRITTTTIMGLDAPGGFELTISR
ncbi:hypothetical protein [Croceibacterium ferulae]|uniref:hypothetical protein n=1 Tax=Croceibacterium ferulae TaxID=1854641 RepID=UPI000EAB50A7|nr:hypothetical protein [Croceibacterium ferulae]